MKHYQVATFMSLLAAICFFLAYFIGSRENTLSLVLGFVWLCLGLGNAAFLLKEKDKEKDKDSSKDNKK